MPLPLEYTTRLVEAVTAQDGKLALDVSRDLLVFLASGEAAATPADPAAAMPVVMPADKAEAPRTLAHVIAQMAARGSHVQTARVGTKNAFGLTASELAACRETGAAPATFAKNKARVTKARGANGKAGQHGG